MASGAGVYVDSLMAIFKQQHPHYQPPDFELQPYSDIYLLLILVQLYTFVRCLISKLTVPDLSPCTSVEGEEERDRRRKKSKRKGWRERGNLTESA